MKHIIFFILAFCVLTQSYSGIMTVTKTPSLSSKEKTELIVVEERTDSLFTLNNDIPENIVLISLSLFLLFTLSASIPNLTRNLAEGMLFVFMLIFLFYSLYFILSYFDNFIRYIEIAFYIFLGILLFIFSGRSLVFMTFAAIYALITKKTPHVFVFIISIFLILSLNLLVIFSTILVVILGVLVGKTINKFMPKKFKKQQKEFKSWGKENKKKKKKKKVRSYYLSGSSTII